MVACNQINRSGPSRAPHSCPLGALGNLGIDGELRRAHDALARLWSAGAGWHVLRALRLGAVGARAAARRCHDAFHRELVAHAVAHA